RLDEPVEQITTAGDRVTGVITAKGELKADMIATNGDVVHSYGLIKDHPRGKQAEAKLKRRSFSPSLFVVHFGLKGTFPDIPHHSILFSDRYGPLLKDIYKNGVLAEDPSLYLHHPTITDPSMAPPG
ncbi:MAG: phytoene desaturase, partial [Sphingomonas bacterium]|nr:phytoene desaturase [Sphingomonas bacterium]